MRLNVSLFLLATACAIGLGCPIAPGGAVTLPSEATDGVVRIPQNLVWERILEIPMGGGQEPARPKNPSTRCLDPARCLAVIRSGGYREGDMRLAVTGLLPGPADVELRYEHPSSKEKLRATLHFEFLPPENLPTLQLGEMIPQGPVLFAEVPSEFAFAGSSQPARCEPLSAARTGYQCFAIEEVAGQLRYAACSTTERCPMKFPPFGFRLTVNQGGRIIGIASHSRDRSRLFGQWGNLGEALAAPP